MSTPEVDRPRRRYAARVPLDVRREQLLDAALTVIDRDGHQRASIETIAREAGVTRPVVYGAYGDLETLLGALLDRQQGRALSQLYAALPLHQPAGTGATLATLIDEAAPRLHAMLIADPVTWRVILHTPTTMPPAVRHRIASDRDQVRRLVEAYLAETLPPGTDTELVAHAVVALLERFGQLALADPERFTAERLRALAQSMTGLLLEA